MSLEVECHNWSRLNEWNDSIEAVQMCEIMDEPPQYKVNLHRREYIIVFIIIVDFMEWALL